MEQQLLTLFFFLRAAELLAPEAEGVETELTSEELRERLVSESMVAAHRPDDGGFGQL